MTVKFKQIYTPNKNRGTLVRSITLVLSGFCLLAVPLMVLYSGEGAAEGTSAKKVYIKGNESSRANLVVDSGPDKRSSIQKTAKKISKQSRAKVRKAVKKARPAAAKVIRTRKVTRKVNPQVINQEVSKARLATPPERPTLATLDKGFKSPDLDGLPTQGLNLIHAQKPARESAQEAVTAIEETDSLNTSSQKVESLSSTGRMLVSSTRTYEGGKVGGYQFINHTGPFLRKEGGKYVETVNGGEKVALTIDPELQEYATELLKKYRLPWGALVALEPNTGRVIALAGHSEVDPRRGQGLVAENTFPAASLFKIITAAAAVETSGLASETPIKYRGGTYSLGKHNYLPNARSDKLEMTLGTALAKSCNPAFARVALNNLSVEVLTQYAHNFGFSKQLAADFPVSSSTLNTEPDSYNLARTAAGFGEALISPVHAAAMIAAVGNRGVMMRPYLVDSLADRSGLVKLRNEPTVYEQVILESTASELLAMMESTTTEGTGKKQFQSASPQLKRMPIASKTGTLSGTNPKGLHYWFVAVAPADSLTNKPAIALAALVVDNGTARVNGVGIGKKFLEKYYNTGSQYYDTTPVVRASMAKKKKVNKARVSKRKPTQKKIVRNSKRKK